MAETVEVILLVLFTATTHSVMIPPSYDRLESFFNHSQFYNIDIDCKKELAEISSHIGDPNGKLEYLRLHFKSFSLGRSNEFLSESKWLHNMLDCFLTPTEKSKTRSFCYGYDSRSSDSAAYAICIPRECSASSLELLYKWKELSSGDHSVIDSSTCVHSKRDRPWYLSIPLLQLVFHFALALVLVIATLYHEQIQNSRLLSAQILFAFSMKRNLRKLVEMPKNAQYTITCMFGMRFISMIWTLIGHCFAWIQGYIENVDEFNDSLAGNFANVWITNFNLGVDTFFVLSATLASYSWFTKNLVNDSSEEFEPRWSSWEYWIRYYRHRVIRLWPAYLITIAMITFIFSRMHTHAMWPPSDPSIQCVRHGWKNIFFLNSLLGNECMGWTWYIGTEFLFYLTTPIFLLSLKHSSLFGFSVSIATVLFSSFLNVMVMMQKNYAPVPLNFKQPPIFNGTFMEQVNDYYIKPQYRISPYIIGLLLGYVLARGQLAKVHTPPSTLFKVFGWLCCFIFGSWSLFGVHPCAQGWNVPLYHLTYGATFRITWGLSMAWIIYACHTGIGGIVNDILSMTFLIPLSSLCYSVYLFHLLALFATFMWSPFPIVFKSKLPIFALCIPQLLISYFAAFLISISAEHPALNIERIFVSSAPKRKFKVDNSLERIWQLWKEFCMFLEATFISEEVHAHLK